MKKWWYKNKNWVIGVCVALGILIVGGLVLNSTGAVDIPELDLSKKERNAANLIIVDDNYEDIDGEYSGVDVKINKDGSITLDGKADSDITLTLLTDADGFGAEALMTLSGIDFGEDGEGSYIAVYDGSEVEAKAENTAAVFISTGTTEHTVKLFIPADAEFENLTVYPMLNYGVTAEAYFD